MSFIISCNFESTSSLDQLYLKEFCAISNPETATPPALEAFPGAYNILRALNTFIAPGTHGMFAPSLTQIHPLLISDFASFSFSSF